MGDLFDELFTALKLKHNDDLDEITEDWEPIRSYLMGSTNELNIDDPIKQIVIKLKKKSTQADFKTNIKKLDKKIGYFVKSSHEGLYTNSEGGRRHRRSRRRVRRSRRVTRRLRR